MMNHGLERFRPDESFASSLPGWLPRRSRNSFSLLLRGISEELLHRNLSIADHTSPGALQQRMSAKFDACGPE
jgi:hypothetical protein